MTWVISVGVSNRGPNMLFFGSLPPEMSDCFGDFLLIPKLIAVPDIGLQDNEFAMIRNIGGIIEEF